MVLAGFTGGKAIFDAEVYPNYILLRSDNVNTRQITSFRIDFDYGVDERKAAEAYYRSLEVAVTYNGHGYDDHILDAVFKGLAARTSTCTATTSSGTGGGATRRS